jgi:hypothetical protein
LYVSLLITIEYLLYEENKFLILLSTVNKLLAGGSDKTISYGLKNLLAFVVNVVLLLVAL